MSVIPRLIEIPRMIEIKKAGDHLSDILSHAGSESLYPMSLCTYAILYEIFMRRLKDREVECN